MSNEQNIIRNKIDVIKIINDQSKNIVDPLMRVEEQEINKEKWSAFENSDKETLENESEDDWLNQYFFDQTGL